MNRNSKAQKGLLIAVEKGYTINKQGNVRNPKGNTVNGFLNKEGYRTFGIRNKTAVYKIAFHRFQAYQKYGDLIFDSKMVSRHKNNIISDNTWNNILIGSQSMNMMDIPKETRIKRAIHAASFLKKYNNEKVISFYEKVKSYKKTMEHFNISSKGTLHYILNN